MQETQKTEERHWISRWPVTLAIVVVALAISTAVVLTQHRPYPVSTPAQCQAQHDIYSPQGCIGSEGTMGTMNSTGSATAITPPPYPVSTPAQCQAQHDIYSPQGCIGSEGVGTTGNTTAITPPAPVGTVTG